MTVRAIRNKSRLYIINQIEKDVICCLYVEEIQLVSTPQSKMKQEIFFTALIITLCNAQSRDFAFTNIGSFLINESGATFEKNYFIPRFMKASWSNVPSICRTFSMEFVSMESLAEMNFVLDALRHAVASDARRREHFHIGAATNVLGSRTFWNWINTGNRVNYDLRFCSSQPGNELGDENCLVVDVDANFCLSDAPCHSNIFNEQQFICQTRNFRA